MTTWGSTAAKAKFSEVMDKALHEGPQLVTRRKDEVIMVSRADWEARGKTDKPEETVNFVSAWEALRVELPPGPDLVIPKHRWRSRKVQF